MSTACHDRRHDPNGYPMCYSAALSLGKHEGNPPGCFIETVGMREKEPSRQALLLVVQ